MDYIGFVHTEAESDPLSDYDLSLDAVKGISIDASRFGNEARMCNDFRGCGERATVELRLREGIWQGKEVTTMSLFSLKEISRGEELLLSYGRGVLFDYQTGIRLIQYTCRLLESKTQRRKKLIHWK